MYPDCDTVVSVRDNIIETNDIDVEFNARGLGDQFYKLMLNNSQKTAQIDGITGEIQTYEELLSRCIKAAEAMRKYGVKPGDVITPCTDNNFDTCVPFIASLFIGAYSAPVDIVLPEDEMEYLVNQYEPKIVFCSSNVEEVLESRLKKWKVNSLIVVFGKGKNHINFDDFLLSASKSTTFEVYNSKSIMDTAYISLTGGTSGRHKAVRLHHLSMFNFISTSTCSSQNEVLLSFSPMVWITGLLCISQAITYGSARLILPKFDPETFFHLVSKYKITNIMLAGFAVAQLSKQNVPKDVDVSFLKSIQYVGSPLSKACVQQLRKMLPTTVISSGYGQTEAGGFMLCYDWSAHPEHFEDKSESLGKPMTGISYKVIDLDTGEALGPNKPGHLLLKTNFQMNGYFKYDSSHVWNEEGWLKTGDMVYYDKQYFFYYVDRIKEMMKYRSWGVSPLYLENILLTHPSVEIAFVTAIPHDQDGDHPIAVVVLKETCTATITELEKFVNDQVDEPSKLREGVRIVKKDFVPYSAMGKIKRYEFRRKILELIQCNPK